METKKIINWANLSRMLAGSRQTVRKNKIPEIHQSFVNELVDTIETVINKYNKTKNYGDNKSL